VLRGESLPGIPAQGRLPRESVWFAGEKLGFLAISELMFPR
jgi:hypothetical protein